MRVAVFTDDDFDAVCGTTTALTALLRFAPPDVSPRIYTASALGVDQPDYFAHATPGIRIPFADRRLRVPGRSAVLGQLRRDGAAVVHIATAGPIGLMALHLATRIGMPCVGSLHEDLEARMAARSRSARIGRLAGRYQRWLYDRCQTVLVPSRAAKARLIARGVREDRLVVWSHGVDVDRLSPARRSAQLRAQWRVSERQPALLFVGDLVPGHGVEALPALSDAVRGAGADHRLLVVGDGPLRRRLASDLPNAILFGALEREQLADIYASADVLIHPGESDLTGMVVLEAQASGLPVVASTRGAAREDLVPDASGILCADSDHWRAALVRLLGSAALRHQMGVAARRLALDRQWALTLDPLFSAYRLAAASTSPGGSPDLARPVS